MRHRLRYVAGSTCALVALVGLAAGVAGGADTGAAGPRSPAAAAPPAPASASASADERLKQGEYLAHAADCVACHSAPDGAAYAGGRGMGTPLGVIYTTNITPDPETGIGRYSLEDFGRAVREGVAKDGHHLYPAMPYPSYAKISDADIAALYAYFMQDVRPVRVRNRPDEIPWYLRLRWAMPIWNLFFYQGGTYHNAANHDAQWNRGAYLVQGPGHCGACHTPRGWLFQEKALSDASRVYLSGGSLDNWSAPDLGGDAGFGLGRWSEAEITQFLRTGHGAGATVFGSMLDAVNYGTEYLSQQDDAAIAHYLKSLPPAAPGRSPQSWSYDDSATRALDTLQLKTPGAQVYYNDCAGCHQRDGRGQAPYMPALAGNPAVLDPNPVSLINITLNGSAPVVVGGDPDFYRMASFRTLLDDQQIADVVNYIRSSWGNQASAVGAADVARLRSQTDAVQVEQLNLLRMR